MSRQAVLRLVCMEVEHLTDATETVEFAVSLESVVQVAGGEVGETNNRCK